MSVLDYSFLVLARFSIGTIWFSRSEKLVGFVTDDHFCVGADLQLRAISYS